MHFLCIIFFDRNSLARGSLSQKFHFSYFQHIFSYVHVILHKIKCLLSSFQPNTSKMVKTTKKFEISTLSYPKISFTLSVKEILDYWLYMAIFSVGEFALVGISLFSVAHSSVGGGHVRIRIMSTGSSRAPQYTHILSMRSLLMSPSSNYGSVQ